MSSLFVSALPGELRAAWLRGGRLQGLLVDGRLRVARPGDLYRGRVQRIDPRLRAAFVDIGGPSDGFLPVTNSRKVSEGEALVVRVQRPASENKGPKLSTQVGNLQPEWETGPAPRLLHASVEPLEEFFGALGRPERVLCDDPALLGRIKQFYAPSEGEAGLETALYSGAIPLFEAEGIEEEIEALLQPEVPLPIGGSLLIEPVRTLTAIDVNAGNSRSSALALDLAAVEEIARQLRLRALSGLIVVDFLELPDHAGRNAVAQSLRKALRPEPEAVQVSPMRASGLVEIARQRLRPALHEVLTEPAGLWGSGRRKTASSLAFEALRALRAEAARHPGKPLGIIASPRIVEALKTSEAEARLAVETAIGRRIALSAEAGEHGYRIVLASPS